MKRLFCVRSSQKLCLAVAMATLCVAVNDAPVLAKEAKKSEAPAASMPITVYADYLSFNSETGDILARGAVRMMQNNQTLRTALLEANSKTMDVWIANEAEYQEPNTALVGNNTHYNWGDKKGEIHEAHGKIGAQLVKGQTVRILPDKYVIEEGTMTRCPAKEPDYHISADRVEIWPNDKLIAYNAKFWIKGKLIYQQDRYTQSIKPGEDKSAFPRIGYDDDDGAYISQSIAYPIDNKSAAVLDWAYYSQSGFKAMVGAERGERNFKVRVSEGDTKDDDGNWVEKEPELRVDYYPHKVGDGPLNYSAYALRGKWTDDNKTSWHGEYKVNLWRDPISLSDDKSLKLHLGTGMKWVTESYNDSSSRGWNYGITLRKRWSESVHAWTGYYYTQNNRQLFDFDAVDLSKNLQTGVRFKLDKKNAFQVVTSYDLENDHLYDLDYYWIRDLHCWQAVLKYRAKRGEISYQVHLTRW